MAEALQAAPGRTLRIHFTITLPGDGDLVAESTEGDEPLEFTLGDGTMDEGLETLILGMGEGETREVEVGPGIAFGERDDAAMEDIPLSDFPKDMELEPGTVVEFEGEGGEAVPAVIVEIDDKQARVDFNHPLAGRPFGFKVHVLSIS
ncbi:MAG: FKBP-type peptidyl-prolyl cis-trans isomerase [Gammaproteobacteria bacterium]